MAKLKPRMFLGSSSEAKEKKIPDAFIRALGDCALVDPWWLSVSFKPMHSTLSALRDAAQDYDFGLFILTPDDQFESRGQKGASARDNVLFELGLFLGALGPDRTFAVIEDTDEADKKVKVPSDLAGIHIDRFSNLTSDDLMASANFVSLAIRRQVDALGRRQRRFMLVSQYGFDKDSRTLSMIVPAIRIREHKEKLAGKKLVVVARKQNAGYLFEEDPHIAIGAPRAISKFSDQDLELKAAHEDLFANIQAGDLIEGHLLLLLDTLTLNGLTTISEMIDKGAELLDSYGYEL